MDDQASEGSTGALRSERARAALFTAPDVVEGMVPLNATSIIEYLAGGTEIAIVFGLIGKTLGPEERTPLSVDTIHDQTRPSGGCTSEYCARALVLTIRAYDDTAF